LCNLRNRELSHAPFYLPSQTSNRLKKQFFTISLDLKSTLSCSVIHRDRAGQRFRSSRTALPAIPIA
jgi:hypothetical protein